MPQWRVRTRVAYDQLQAGVHGPAATWPTRGRAAAAAATGAATEMASRVLRAAGVSTGRPFWPARRATRGACVASAMRTVSGVLYASSLASAAPASLRPYQGPQVLNCGPAGAPGRPLWAAGAEACGTSAHWPHETPGACTAAARHQGWAVLPRVRLLVVGRR